MPDWNEKGLSDWGARHSRLGQRQKRIAHVLVDALVAVFGAQQQRGARVAASRKCKRTCKRPKRRPIIEGAHENVRVLLQDGGEPSLGCLACNENESRTAARWSPVLAVSTGKIHIVLVRGDVAPAKAGVHGIERLAGGLGDSREEEEAQQHFALFQERSDP